MEHKKERKEELEEVNVEVGWRENTRQIIESKEIAWNLKEKRLRCLFFGVAICFVYIDTILLLRVCFTVATVVVIKS